jgi:predicted nucleotidyltransferase
MVRFRESGLWGQPMDQVDIQKLTEHFTARPALGVASAYLFGSHAEGRAHRESDVDLVQLRAADLAPFLRKMRRIKLEALARQP